jgi:hypothetical protein
VILKPISHRTRVRALVHFEAICDSILIEHIVQLGGIDSKSVLIANIDRDPAVLAKISNVLIYERKRRIRGPSRQDIRLCYSVLHRQIKIERWILRIR